MCLCLKKDIANDWVMRAQEGGVEGGPLKEPGIKQDPGKTRPREL